MELWLGALIIRQRDFSKLRAPAGFFPQLMPVDSACSWDRQGVEPAHEVILGRLI
jgi:hypothetical protein